MDLFLFLDYDGTLSPIARKPKAAVFPEETKAVLSALAKTRGIKIAVISGRSLTNLKRITGLKNMVLAGNHGLEIEGPGFKFKAPVKKRVLTALQSIKHKLAERFTHTGGVILEDKGPVLSVHYRMAKPSARRLILKAIREEAKPYLQKKVLKLSGGKKVLEIKPNIDWDKGKAVNWIMSKYERSLGSQRTLPVYVGDDKTDEDAFRVLKGKGITIHVGTGGKTLAGGRLKDPAQVYKFLKGLYNECK